MKILLVFFLTIHLYALEIIDKPITFDEQRINLTKKYLLEHYALKVDKINITARLIVIHWTAQNDFDKSFLRFKDSTLPQDRGDIAKASALNVSSHFLIARDGKVYRLMPEHYMARHVIGLNYNAIGIENVGGKNSINNLTALQLQANIALVAYLKNKYPSINYMIGHHEYTQCESLDLWLEKDKNYRTTKYDPGKKFMQALRNKLPSLKTCAKAQND